MMKGFIAGIVLALVLIVACVFGGIYFGVFPIGADNPPGRIERTLANLAMDQYVDRHMPTQANPVQVSSATLIEGARVYEENCSFCHGGAAQTTSPMRQHFNPPVPQLLQDIPDDPSAHLFWVTKHGIRLTGMPAWGGFLTDDQIWKAVTFIKHSDKLPPEVQSAWQQLGQPKPPVTPAPKQKGPAGRPGK